MEVIREDIVAGLRAIGLPVGAVALVHSSLSSFGHVAGGAPTVIRALVDAVGVEGTIMVPTLTGSEALGPDNPPVYDVRTTPCWTGCIPETFRQRSDARRSLHPTHSVAAIGHSREDLLRGHELSPTPCGPDTPYGRLASAENGYVVFLGVGLHSNTMMHHAEEVAAVPYHMQPAPVIATVTDYDGITRQLRLWLHSYSGGRRNFPRPEPYFLAKGIERVGRIGNCTVKILKVQPMVQYVLERLKADPAYLLAKGASDPGPTNG
ncbi:MAG: AAC(3) family N-acetyltransferase [Anaerolineae bacterium]